MQKHGQESYFVIGEGLLTESGAGRATASAAKASPPFRFSRMGPKGSGDQLGEANRKKIAALMAAGGGEVSHHPVRLHLPRPVHRPRPDVRQDERHARRT